MPLGGLVARGGLGVGADNAAVLPELPDGAFTMIYLDPPFNTGRAQVRRSIRTVRSAGPGAA